MTRAARKSVRSISCKPQPGSYSSLRSKECRQASMRSISMPPPNASRPPFLSAGPHFNPTNEKHGMLSGHGHAGDMPNLHVPQNGELSVEVLNTAVTLEKGKPNSLFHPDGTAVVVHEGVDDYKSDPAGNAGNRLACGVIAGPGSGNAPTR